MNETSALETVLKRDRMVVITCLAIVILLAWIYLLSGAGMDMRTGKMTAMTQPSFGSDEQQPSPEGMTSAPGLGTMMQKAHTAMVQPADWTPGYALLIFCMWWVMMVAMMLPSASPMILLFALVNRRQRTQGAPFIPAGVFAAGYLITWGGFSLVATGLQWFLERAELLSTMMASTSVRFAGFLLIAAGIYQLTPLKYACLRHCWSPMQFIMQYWRSGTFGALRMGIKHGLFCLGCCWLLMGLLFVGGVMNLYWIIGLAILVLLEKIIPAGHWMGWITGAGLIVWGGWIVLGAW